MEPVAIVLESLLGLFLLLSGCLVIRTLMLEAPQPQHVVRSKKIIVHMKEDLDRVEHREPEVIDLKELEACGLTPEEIAALRRLKKWYQAGEGDRAVLLARWECLRRLKLNGKLDV
jgi:hypothetical protein